MMKIHKNNKLQVYVFLGLIVLLFSNIPVNQIKQVKLFDVDVLGNIYTLNKEGVVNAYDKNFKIKASYSNLSYGEIHSIEAEDALNIMVYYSYDEKIVFLDNSLNIKKSAIDLTALGYGEAKLATASYNTGFWIYDPVSMELVRLNRLLEKTNSSGNLLQILGENIHPQLLRETNNTLIVSDSLSGVFLFDRYGTFVRKIPIKDIVEFQLNGRSLKLLKKDSLFSYDIQTLQMDSLALGYKNIKKIKFLGNKIYYLNSSDNLTVEMAK